MTDEEFLELFQSLPVFQPRVLEFRAYYADDGKILSYTTEDIPGKYIVITSDQYAESRHDAKVIDGKLVYTHRRSHVFKLVKNKTDGVRTSKYDISVIQNDDESTYYRITAYEIKR